MFWISLTLSVAICALIVGSLWNRIQVKKGIGWQFIRLNTIVISLLLVGLLAINNALTSEASTIIAGAMGYAFGNAGEKANA